MYTFHPGGASGILLKLNVTSSDVYADILGLRLDCLNKFNVYVNSLIWRQNKRIGKFVSVMKITAMKWFLHVYIALYTEFILCNPGGTIWNYTPWF